MKTKILFLVLIAMFLFTLETQAIQWVGGKGLFYTAYAQSYAPGQLGINLFTRSYAVPVTERYIRNNSLTISGSFGFTKTMELGLTQSIFQDVNYNYWDDEKNYMSPGYSQFHLKFANYKMPFGQNFLFYGVSTSFTKQGQYANIYLEPYYDFGIAGQVDFLCSYFFNPYYPEESPSLHMNLGFVNYNDKEKIFQSSQAIPLSLAYVKSTLKYQYSAELHGSFFVKEPPVTAFSREDYLYFSPGFKFKLFLGFQVGAGIDVLLLGNDETTVNNSTLNWNQDDNPNYANWRFNMKIDYIPSTAFYEIPTFEKVTEQSVSRETLRARRVITDRKALFEWVVDENKGAEYYDLELEKIRDERKKAEEELERLKKDLEAKSK